MSVVNSSVPQRTFNTAKLGSIVLVALVIAGLAALDWSLAQTEQVEIQKSAQRAYRKGRDLFQKGRTTEALEFLRTAHALERHDEQYELGLIEALTATGKISEAEPLMNEVLEHKPNDGQANLIAARLMTKKGEFREAEPYYHRAIYGEWPDNAHEHRIAARLELIQIVQTHGSQGDLLAELLPLEEEAAKNEQLQLKVAHLLLVAGSPSRSAELYSTILQREPQSMAACLGLAEADLQRGEYRRAHANFLRAYHHDENDSWIRSRMELSNELSELDPTVRQLSSLDKYRRSLRILQLARNNLQECLSREPNANSGDAQQLLSSASKAVSAKFPKHVTNEMAERELGLAENLWQARLKTCGKITTSHEEPLRLIMEKLAQ
jgi:thioredoxin-like negative regulator of GroEL